MLTLLCCSLLRKILNEPGQRPQYRIHLIKPHTSKYVTTNADDCSICKNIIRAFEESYVSATRCDIFSSSEAKSKCIKYATNDDLATRIVILLYYECSRETICKYLGECQIDNHFEEKESYQDFYYSNDEEDLEIPEGLTNGIACSICKHLVTVISNIIETKIKPIQVQEEAQKLCSKFPKIGRDFCNNIITKYLTKITELIQQKVSISNVCDKLKLCVSNSDDDDSYLELYLDMDDNDFVSDFELPMSLSNADTCSICAKAVKFVDKVLRSHKPAATVVALCNALKPQVHANLCKAIVSTSIGGIAQQLKLTSSYEQVCNNLKFCDSANEEIDEEEVYAPNRYEQVHCSMCLTFAYAINENLLKGNEIEEITKDAVCSHFPEGYKKECHGLYKSINLFIDAMEEGIPFDEVCTALGLCSGHH
ncbi:prosaposin isoform X2 [Histomonas meleagridis]|uniref:prosaposin isoform X2 n=1 Tax=Histomonas meleagridis TaxID=135588 RepID=UPI00355A2400|nr:prosaposin isoform X2 [Histomonas meleagridis]KAH0796099.1 prosaposin isoform X2 [Histomonas meleagridis]